MGPIDIVIPLGVGSKYDNFELRYSLRSVCKYYHHRNIIIVGHLPRWVRNVIHIPCKDIEPKNYSIARKVLRACMYPGISDTFVMKADDIFFNKPTGDIHDYYNGTKENAVANPKFGSVYRKAIINTPGELYFDIHTPVVFDKAKFVELMAEPWQGDMVLKTLYKNKYPGKRVEMRDAKITDANIPDMPFFSTPSFIPKPLMRHIEQLFPVPSRYEADNSANV